MEIKSFAKIYLWNILSLITNFLSVFIVTPFLAADPTTYGIYTLIGSVYIFFSYADLGFMGAAQKYAAENFIQGKREEEVRVIGFAGFILLCLIVLYSVGIGVAAVKPSLLINNIQAAAQEQVARNLLLTLALFAPGFVIQRVLQVIFAVRLKDYIFQRVLIVSNLLKIGIAFLLFAGPDYPIVQYFLASQLCNAVAMVIGLFLARRYFNYPLGRLLRSFRYSKAMFRKTKSLAGVSIFLVFCWVLYYELDAFVISKVLGATALGFYAIGLSLSSYLRAVYGIIFSPFAIRFNHYVGLAQQEALHVFFAQVVRLCLPLTLFPVVVLVLTMKNFIFSWVGTGYAPAIVTGQLLVLCYAFGYVINPTGLLLIAQQKVRMLYLVNALLPIVYWLGVLLTYERMGIQAFALFKLVAFVVVFVLYGLFIQKKVMRSGVRALVVQFASAAIPVAGVILASGFLNHYLPSEKSKGNLMLYFFFAAMLMGLAMLLYLVVNKEARNLLLGFIRPKLTPTT